jgi:RNA polymerase sigma-70 factor (ECF subfamily)
VVQDTWLRWQDAERDAVRNAEASLVTTATRLAIDRLRSARARRESYVGTWLPDPLVSDPDDPPGDRDRGGDIEPRPAVRWSG